MRMPGLDPKQALSSIRTAHRAGTLQKVADSIDPNKGVFHWSAPNGTSLFPVVADDGMVITVLTLGMETITPTGRVVLTAPEQPAQPDVTPPPEPVAPAHLVLRGTPVARADAPLAQRAWLGPGVYDLPAEVYHADPCERPALSAGLAAKMLEATPLHAYAASPRLNPEFEPDEKTAFDIGSAAHELMTGKGRGIHVVDADDYKKKAAQEERDQARANGFTPLTRKQNEQVQRMVRLARVQMRAHGIGDPFEQGRNETTLIWQQDGVMNRIMIDCLDERNRVAYDLKTLAGVADADKWLRRSMDHGVDLRAAHYLDGLKACFGGNWTYRFVLLEKDQPHCLSVAQLSENTLYMGRKKIRRARQMWGHCLATNTWPGFSAEIAVVEPPAFYESRWLERESYEADHKRRTGSDILTAAMMWQAPIAS